MVDKMIQNLEAKTGKKMQEWIEITQKCGEEKHMAKIKFLKEKHGLTHGYANLIVHAAKEGGLPEKETNLDVLVQKQYEKKPALKPIYELLLKQLATLGKDVEIAPKKAYVSIRRKKQFALLQPSTKARLDIGIKLKDTAITDRLEKAGSFNTMISHRVRITAEEQVDKEVLAWLKKAYEQAG